MPVLLAGSTALGETAAKSGTGSGSFLGMWSIKAMVDQACTNIARRYNLNERQEVYTRALMANRVQQFVQEHGSEVESLIADMMRRAADPSNPPPKESVQDWGRRSLPIYEAARRAILDGNKDWREVLNEEQRKIHDFDLAQMRTTFQYMEKQFTRWEEGQFRPGESPFPGLPQLASQAGQVSPGMAPVQTEESLWNQWVFQFVRDYKLDQAQTASALGILQDCKVRAADYRRTHQGELFTVKAKILELRSAKDAKNPEEMKKAEARLQELQKPFEELFKELKDRVSRIPTESQRAAYAEAKKAGPQQGGTKVRATATRPASQPERKTSAVR